MSLLSLFPERYATIETWITRLFLFLGLFIIGPWAALVIYDVILYIVRRITYDIPIVGGRARGKARPRAPSLTERPTGQRRRFSLARRPEEEERNSARPERPEGARIRRITEENNQAAID